ncbi:hypothetical protein SAMN06265218_107102 [Fodinibius sediminis]|uniref:Uncharacterized protein n=1 Tax=Fodinibius sediminis TaxID=1214077 RepID=A0A521CVR7_9BACT|nr:hypothetical protein SAMN06265218_107102 [Fodinibius sediminis]
MDGGIQGDHRQSFIHIPSVFLETSLLNMRICYSTVHRNHFLEGT